MYLSERARISCVIEGLAEKNLARQTVGTIALEMSNSIVLAMSVYLFVRGCSTDANVRVTNFRNINSEYSQEQIFIVII